tara:strand:+ start:1047 stop:1349 length:303 start_codon:yes stop_codon:yes gene_type:complete
MNTEQLIETSRARFEHVAARRVLKEKYQAKMLFAHGGGMWTAGPELLILLATCPPTVVILDLYETPIQINTAELQTLALARWQEQMNAWLIEHEELSKKR